MKHMQYRKWDRMTGQDEAVIISDGNIKVEIPASTLENGCASIEFGNKHILLSSEERLLLCAFVQSNRKILKKDGVRTLLGWQESGLDLCDYMYPGDEVADDFIEYVRRFPPAITDWKTLVQGGEPSFMYDDDMVDTFWTFTRDDTYSPWRFAGFCREGERVNCWKWENVSRLRRELRALV